MIAVRIGPAMKVTVGARRSVYLIDRYCDPRAARYTKILLYLYFLFRIVCPHCVKNELGLHLCRGASTHGATCKVVDYEADVYNMSGSSASACLSAPKKLSASCPCGVSMKVPMYWKSE